MSLTLHSTCCLRIVDLGKIHPRRHILQDLPQLHRQQDHQHQQQRCWNPLTAYENPMVCRSSLALDGEKMHPPWLVLGGVRLPVVEGQRGDVQVWSTVFERQLGRKTRWGWYSYHRHGGEKRLSHQSGVGKRTRLPGVESWSCNWCHLSGGDQRDDGLRPCARCPPRIKARLRHRYQSDAGRQVVLPCSLDRRR